MAVSEISICNSGLIKIGATPIVSFDEQRKEAKILKIMYPALRDSMLRAHTWNFATKWQALAPLALVNVAPNVWSTAFQLPTDWLRTVKVDPDYIEYSIEGRQIMANTKTLNMRYIWQNLDPTQWDASFCEALAYRVARDTCYQITNNASLVSVIDAGYKTAFAEARGVNAQEKTPEDFQSYDWVRSRF